MVGFPARADHHVGRCAGRRHPGRGWGWLSLATGVAVVDAVAPLLEGTGAEAGLKWPNDVLAGPPDSPGKLAGILAEVARPFVVIGLGLNVTQAPEEVDGPGATSLLDLGVAAPDRDQLVRRLLRELGGGSSPGGPHGSRLAAGGRLPGAQPDDRLTRARAPPRRQRNRRDRQRHR